MKKKIEIKNKSTKTNGYLNLGKTEFKIFCGVFSSLKLV